MNEERNQYHKANQQMQASINSHQKKQIAYQQQNQANQQPAFMTQYGDKHQYTLQTVKPLVIQPHAGFNNSFYNHGHGAMPLHHQV